VEVIASIEEVNEGEWLLEGEALLVMVARSLYYDQHTSAFPQPNSGFSQDICWQTQLRHTVNTGDAEPVRCVSPQQVRALLSEMLNHVVIENSTSPWASPIVLVNKKDGRTRRRLSPRQQCDPQRRIDTTLDTLAASQWFCTLDLLSGYWQAEIEETDRPKTAFCTTEGLFQFWVMLFGLCNATATFQCLMDLELSGLQWSHCLMYLDDVIVLDCTFKQHAICSPCYIQRLRGSG
jgi:hypothetical protein